MKLFKGMLCAAALALAGILAVGSFELAFAGNDSTLSARARFAQECWGVFSTTPSAQTDGDPAPIGINKYRAVRTAPDQASAWSTYHSPAVSATATITKAAGAAGVERDCRGFIFPA